MGRRESKSSPVTNGQFDFMKRTAELGLPAVGALYFGLAQIWGLPAAEEVVGTVAILNTFVGVVVVIVRGQYNTNTEVKSGTLDVVTHEDGVQSATFNADMDLEDMMTADKVVFTVVRKPIE